jgi:NAD+ synthase (glutamine-hydrolysing)
MNHGFLKVAAAVPDLRVADCGYNARRIEAMMRRANDEGVEALCFPELSITGYTCGDLFFQSTLLDSAEKALFDLRRASASMPRLLVAVGLPLRFEGKLYNAAAWLRGGAILGFVPKTFLPNYSEFQEKRWFASADEASGNAVTLDREYPFTPRLLVGNEKVVIAAEICEDLWVTDPPSARHCRAGATVVFNLSASNELTGKHAYRKALVGQQSARCIAGYVYAGAGRGESSTDLVFAGNGLVYENGVLLCEAERFAFDEQLAVSDIDTDLLRARRMKNTSFACRRDGDYTFVRADFSETNVGLHRRVNPLPFVPASDDNETLDEVFAIQTGGLARRVAHTGAQRMVVGVSGGLDSTLALLVCANVCDRLKMNRTNVAGITMPGFGTSRRTANNAVALMREMGVESKTIDIREACLLHFRSLEHDPEVYDTVFENTQARERTQILMDFANKCNGLVVGTGDLSELALGWTTYNGDHMSMYGVNAGVPKTLVRSLVNRIADTSSNVGTRRLLKDILNTPVSPELLPTDETESTVQPTEEIVGPYELHDFFLSYMLRYGYSPRKIFFLATAAFDAVHEPTVVLKWMKVFYRRFFAQQFKRSCLPDGPKVGSVNLSPRGDWRMPSDASAALWMEEIEEIGAATNITK